VWCQIGADHGLDDKLRASAASPDAPAPDASSALAAFAAVHAQEAAARTLSPRLSSSGRFTKLRVEVTE
jgi:hypothetical protein